MILAAVPERTGAQPLAPAFPESAGCREEKARSAIGEPYPRERAERARQASGARVLRPQAGEPDTMELRADRLNLKVDQSGVIRAVRCG
jgi:hypothetical protein